MEDNHTISECSIKEPRVLTVFNGGWAEGFQWEVLVFAIRLATRK